MATTNSVQNGKSCKPGITSTTMAGSSGHLKPSTTNISATVTASIDQCTGGAKVNAAPSTSEIRARVSAQRQVGDFQACRRFTRNFPIMGGQFTRGFIIASCSQMCSARLPDAARQASRKASVKVGCACDMRAMSSAEARNSMATTASAIMSAARGPIICTPRSSSVSRCASTLMSPSVSMLARALPEALKGKVPLWYGICCSRSCSSV
jgi:hypothetical protein